MTRFGESTVLDDGRLVVAPWAKRGVYIGETFFDGPQIRFPDAGIDALGRVWVIGKDQEGKGAFVLCDAVGLWWPVTMTVGGWPVAPTVYGSRTILRADGEGCRIAFTVSAVEWRCLAVRCEGTRVEMAEVGRGTIASGEGGNGMRDWDPDGNPRPVMPLDERVAGHLLRMHVTAGDVAIGSALDLDGAVVLLKGGAVGTLLQSGSNHETLRLSPNGRHWTGIQYVGSRMVGGDVPDAVPPLVTVTKIAPFKTRAHVGCFFADSKRYQTDPPAPGSVSVLVEERLASSRGVVLARLSDETNVDLLAEWRGRWAQVRGIYVTSERGPLRAEAAAARARMSSLGVALRPVISYTGPTLPADLSGIDVVGVEWYLKTDGETVQQAEPRWRAQISLAGGKPLAPMLGMFDRTGQVSEALWGACLPRYEALLRELGDRVRFVLGFSWGRPGGLRDHPALRPWMAALAGAYTPPSSAQPDPPLVTITDYNPQAGAHPLTVRAVRALSGGPATTLTWRMRREGATDWTPVAVNPATDPDHSFVFPSAGSYEIGVDVVGPGGSNGTVTPRKVRVS